MTVYNIFIIQITFFFGYNILHIFALICLYASSLHTGLANLLQSVGQKLKAGCEDENIRNTSKMGGFIYSYKILAFIISDKKIQYPS